MQVEERRRERRQQHRKIGGRKAHDKPCEADRKADNMGEEEHDSVRPVDLPELDLQASTSAADVEESFSQIDLGLRVYEQRKRAPGRQPSRGHQEAPGGSIAEVHSRKPEVHQLSHALPTFLRRLSREKPLLQQFSNVDLAIYGDGVASHDEDSDSDLESIAEVAETMAATKQRKRAGSPPRKTKHHQKTRHMG